MSKTMKWVLAGLSVVLVALLSLLAVLAVQITSFRNGDPSMPGDSVLTLRQQEDDSLLLSWPEAPEADSYYVEVLEAEGGSGSIPLFSAICTETECLLPATLPEERPVALRISGQKTASIMGKDYSRFGEQTATVYCYLNRPVVTAPGADFDALHQTAHLTWSGWKGDTFRLFRSREEGGAQLLRELQEAEATLTFGSEGELPLPGPGESVTLYLEAVREEPGLLFLGKASEPVEIRREDLLGTVLLLECQELGDNAWSLCWNETKGERYEVQRQVSEDMWETLAVIPVGEENRYETGHLPPCETFLLRVAALGGQTLPDSVFAAEPQYVTLETGPSLLYAAMWPLKELPVYAAPDREEVIGTLSPDSACCVLGEENGCLHVASPFFSGYVDENHCMINLPDYIGSLCEYDITNSYASIYMVHEYEIPTVTGTVITGYEDVKLASGEYLVPLLYPTAEKLIAAARAAREDGYRLRIYDSFRPYQATRMLYDTTWGILDTPIPDTTYFGVVLPELPGLRPGETLTYRRMMTNETYALSDFLAGSYSKHNLGVAMDLTLAKEENGMELKMQTSIHDLSWYAATGNNGPNARLLARYMYNAGFGGLSSEWWHFQDNDAINSLGLSKRDTGVSPAGWRGDDSGWRYRRADGSYIAGETAEIDGVLCRFGEDGYLMKD